MMKTWPVPSPLSRTTPFNRMTQTKPKNVKSKTSLAKKSLSASSNDGWKIASPIPPPLRSPWSNVKKKHSYSLSHTSSVVFCDRLMYPRNPAESNQHSDPDYFHDTSARHTPPTSDESTT